MGIIVCWLSKCFTSTLSLPSQGIHSPRPCTYLDSIFGGQIKILLWGIRRDGGILLDPSWFWRFERWQKFSLSSGAVGSEDHCGVTDARRAGAGARGPQWGGSAGGPGAILIASHRDPSKFQARPGYMADTGAARRAGQGSICGKQGVLRRRPRGLAPPCPDLLSPLNLPSSGNMVQPQASISSTLTLFKAPEIWKLDFQTRNTFLKR